MRPTLSSAVAALALAATLAPARALDADRPLLHAIRDSWTRQDGLPSLGVRAIVQAADGYLWIGTEGGLVRFDGVRFVVFDPSTTPELRSPFVSDLLIEPDGGLLVATWDGLFRLKAGRWEEIGAGTEPRRFTALARGSEGGALAIRGGGIVAVKGASLEPLPLRDPESGGAEVAVVKAAADGAGSIWLCADNGKRLLKYDGTSLVEDLLTAGGPAVVTALAADRSGAMWVVATPGGLMRREGTGFVPVPAAPALPSSGAIHLMIDGAGSAWITYDDGTLARVHHGATDLLPGARREFGGATINSILVDVEGSVWMAGSGLHRLKDAPVVTLSEREGWPAGPIASVFADTRGRVWVGPQSGGLWRWDGRALAEVSIGERGERSLVLAIAEDRTGTIWIGTPRRGVYWLGEDGRSHLAAADRRADVVFFLAPCPEERCVLAGMNSGAWQITPDSATRLPFVGAGEVNDPVTSMLADSKGRIWAGTAEHGAFVREGDRWKPAGALQPGGNYVLSLLEDVDGTVWAGTVDGGLRRLGGDPRATPLTRRQGLPSDTIYAVLPGADDDLWLSTPDGLARASRAELIAAAEGRKERAVVDSYAAADGLRSGECTGGGQVASRAPGGRLYFATLGGVAYVDPAMPARDVAPPPVVIEELTCDGHGVDLASGAPRIPAGTARCEIRYTALSLRAPGRLRFRYRLDGLEEFWTDAGIERVARFTHLPPREYAFQVVAASAHGVWNEEGATLRFSIAPHPWETTWFKALAGMLVVGLLAGGYRWRVGALKRRQSALEEAVETRTAELKDVNRTLEQRVQDGIDRLRGAERMAAYGEMVAGVAHEVRHPIFSIRAAAYLIGHKLGTAQGEVADPLSALERETARLSRLMEDLLQFARPPVLARSPTPILPLLKEAVATVQSGGGWEAIAITIEAPQDLPALSIDHGRMHQVLVNLLENARKHAAGITRARIEARIAEDGRMAIEVANDGAGMDPETLPRIFDPFFTRGAGTGLGLAIVQRIVRDHGGSIEVDSAPDRGTRFLVSLPVE